MFGIQNRLFRTVFREPVYRKAAPACCRAAESGMVKNASSLVLVYSESPVYTDVYLRLHDTMSGASGSRHAN